MLLVVEVVMKLHIWWWVLGAKMYVLQLLDAKVLLPSSIFMYNQVTWYND